MKAPDFYKSNKVGTLYKPDLSKVVDFAHSVQLKHAAEDERRILLLLIDPQVDFVHVDGALSVPGAVADTRRTIKWLFHYIEQITDIVTSLDSHSPLQIFFPGWWIDSAGKHPQPLTLITARQVAEGYWQPLFEQDWSRYYVHELEKKAKKSLLIWPYHTMTGTPGHAIDPALYEAIIYHSEARRSQTTFVIKGRNPKTEHYSIFEPEVKVPKEPEGDLNSSLIDKIMTYDLIYIAGQAKSHCVLETVTSIVNYIGDQPDLIGKLRLLSDCMSSVVHPDIDFEALANEKLVYYSKMGLQQVNATDPLE